MRRPPRIITCVCCGQQGPSQGRGLIRACYQRHRSTGVLDRFPMLGKPPVQAGKAAREARLARLEDYADLLAWGASWKEAAARVGVCRRTAERYNAALRTLESESPERKSA
ncbi:hypothetical protein [Streptosporangium jomthongense]|uniref:Uncharacterized protein n=1 Tax=Streptosporangium jomthongense TaxID=1193683 RepID=A0ABV8EUY6_9ACTN